MSMAKYTAQEIGQAKRELVLDLLVARELLQGDNHERSDGKGLIHSAQMRAIRLTQAGVDWRQHKVRAKTYQGPLGVLYDEFKRYQSKHYIEV